jgi:hypothetical protein
VGAPQAGDEVVDADSLAAYLDISAATVRSWLYRRELDADMRRAGSALWWWYSYDCQRVPSEPTAPCSSDEPTGRSSKKVDSHDGQAVHNRAASYRRRGVGAALGHQPAGSDC